MKLNRSLLKSPQAFDELRLNDKAFESLSLLAEEPALTHLEHCRYAQYLLYRENFTAFDNVLSEARRTGSSGLSTALLLKQLIIREEHQALKRKVMTFRPQTSDPLELEGYSLGFESCAYYFAVLCKDFHQAYAYLYRAEAYALALGLKYRLKVIRSKLEATANMAGDTLILNTLSFDESGKADLEAVRNRFESCLRSGNVSEIETLTRKGHLGREEWLLARATLEYQQALEGSGSYSVAAELISDTLPEHPESQLLWSLLMLQLFSVIGPAEGRAEPERIVRVLENSLSKVLHLYPSVVVAASLYPLGVSLAAQLNDRIKLVNEHVTTLNHAPSKGGLFKGKEKLATLTKPVREALILDEAYATQEHLKSALKWPTGHPQNKVRFKKALDKAGTKRHEFVTEGGLFRGYYFLGKALGDHKLLDEAQRLYERSDLLQTVSYR